MCAPALEEILGNLFAYAWRTAASTKPSYTRKLRMETRCEAQDDGAPFDQTVEPGAWRRNFRVGREAAIQIH